MALQCTAMVPQAFPMPQVTCFLCAKAVSRACAAEALQGRLRPGHLSPPAPLPHAHSRLCPHAAPQRRTTAMTLQRCCKDAPTLSPQSTQLTCFTCSCAILCSTLLQHRGSVGQQGGCQVWRPWAALSLLILLVYSVPADTQAQLTGGCDPHLLLINQGRGPSNTRVCLRHYCPSPKGNVRRKPSWYICKVQGPSVSCNGPLAVPQCHCDPFGPQACIQIHASHLGASVPARQAQ